MIDMIIIADAIIGLVTLWVFGGVINNNLGYMSAQLYEIQSDNQKIKSELEQVKKATLEAALDKPLPPRYLDAEALYKSHGGQVR